MGENSAIEWTDHTFNPWWGCTRVSPACDGCYADAFATRLGMGDLWDGTKRRFFGDAHWAEPLRWNEHASQDGVRRRVFCASMADVFDNVVDQAVRERLWRLIEATPHLDWLLLTKRIGNAVRMLDGCPSPNVWLGISVVTQAEVERDVPKLLEIPAHVRFLSCEPLIEPLSFEDLWVKHPNPFVQENYLEALNWLIVGGESGHKARPMDVEWARILRDQCAAAETPFFFKQGSQANWPDFKNFERVPRDLQVREWPMPGRA